MTTLLEDRLTDKGVNKRDIAFRKALALFQNNGGTFGEAIALVNAAYAKAGTPVRAENGRFTSAVRRNDDEAGQRPGADKANRPAPASPSTDRSAGRNAVADKAIREVPAAANKPGHAKRGMDAIRSVQSTMAKSLFDTVKLPDGRRLREVRWSECPALATRYRRLSRIFMAIHNRAVPADPSAYVDSVLDEDGLKEIVEGVERFNDII